MNAKLNTSDLEFWLEESQQADDLLSDWERGFLDSIEVALLKGYGLSGKQRDKLLQIYERVTS